VTLLENSDRSAGSLPTDLTRAGLDSRHGGAAPSRIDGEAARVDIGAHKPQQPIEDPDPEPANPVPVKEPDTPESGPPPGKPKF
jgi:hypothetical protein